MLKNRTRKMSRNVNFCLHKKIILIVNFGLDYCCIFFFMKENKKTTTSLFILF